MLFSDMIFLLYFLPAALVVYWAFPAPAQNVFLLLLSLLFYSWGEPLFLIPMLILIVVNYWFGQQLDGADNPVYKKRVVFRTVIVNIFLLLAVLYGQQAVIWIASHFGYTVAGEPLPVPIGIPFFTLQAMGYVFEIARGKMPPTRNILHTASFIAFMPTVIAGPVLRYEKLTAQFAGRTMSLSALGFGFERVVIGFFKLMVLAAPIGHVATDIFNRSAAGNQFHTTPVILAWLGVLAFGLYYYLALSGLADMAIGLARLFGFTVRENFNYPYAAHTVTEFWKRWHISVFRWFYVYVYMMLGGTRAQLVKFRGAMRPRNYVLRNSFILWMVIGIWHGVSWNHVIFGFWFFVFFFSEWVVSLQRKNTRSPFWMVYVLSVVAVGWVLLRCNTLMDSLTYLSNMLGIAGNGFSSEFANELIREYWPFMVAGVIACTPLAKWVLSVAGKPKSGPLGFLVAVGHFCAMIGIVYLCFVFSGETPELPLFFVR